MARPAVANARLDVDLDAELRQCHIDVEELAQWLDDLTPAARLAAIRSLGGRAQARLYEAVKSVRKLRLEDLVPANVEPLHEVVHEGKNSLPAFTTFAKVFCRPKVDGQEIWGYNRSGPFVERAVGPGYFVAYEGPGDELLIDYTRLPKGTRQGLAGDHPQSRAPEPLRVRRHDRRAASGLQARLDRPRDQERPRPRQLVRPDARLDLNARHVRTVDVAGRHARRGTAYNSVACSRSHGARRRRCRGSARNVFVYVDATARQDTRSADRDQVRLQAMLSLLGGAIDAA